MRVELLVNTLSVFCSPLNCCELRVSGLPGPYNTIHGLVPGANVYKLFQTVLFKHPFVFHKTLCDPDILIYVPWLQCDELLLNLHITYT